MANRALTLRMTTFHTQGQVIPAGNNEINVSMVRAFSRLNAAFLSLTGSMAGDTPTAKNHQATSFLNPSAIIVGGGGNRDEHQMSWDLQLGSLKYPETPCASLPETFSLLQQATNLYDESIRTLAMTPQSYGTLGYCVGVHMQSVPGTPFSSVSTRAGDLLTFRANKIIS